MSGYDEEMLLTVLAGVGEPPLMRLTVDTVLGPLSIGSSGSWRIVAPGVLGEHGYVYFDGTDLFLQSADPENPLLVDGQPVPDAWTPVDWPCEISLGVARLQYTKPGQTAPLHPVGLGQTLPLGFVPSPLPSPLPALRAQPGSNPPVPLLPPEAFEAPPVAAPLPSFDRPRAFNVPSLAELEAGNPLAAQPEPEATPEPQTALKFPPKRPQPQPQPSKSARPFAPGAFSNREPDPDATRLHPIEITAASRNIRAKLPDSDDAIRPIAESHGNAPPLIVAPPIASPQPPPAVMQPQMPLVGAPPGVPLRSDHLPGAAPKRAAPPPGPVAMALGSLATHWQEASGVQKALVVLLVPLLGSVWIIFTDLPSSRTKPAAPTASATTSAWVAATTTPAESSSAPGPVSSLEKPAASERPVASEKPTSAATARPAETSRVVAPPPPASTSTPSSGGKTAQREAADAVAAGAFDEAAKLYEELAKAHPDVPAYAEAARILRAKVKK
jgi:hypothetical protein